MYKNLQYNRIWTLYLLFYNLDGTTSSRMKRNHSAFQDFISCTFLDLTWHYSFHPPSTIILLAIFADMHWLENILYFIKALLSSSTRCHVAFKQQLPLTFYTPHKIKAGSRLFTVSAKESGPSFPLPFWHFAFFSSNEFIILENCN